MSRESVQSIWSGVRARFARSESRPLTGWRLVVAYAVMPVVMVAAAAVVDGVWTALFVALLFGGALWVESPAGASVRLRWPEVGRGALAVASALAGSLVFSDHSVWFLAATLSVVVVLFVPTIFCLRRLEPPRVDGPVAG